MYLSECRKPVRYAKTIVVENGPKRDVEEIVQEYKDSLNAEYFHLIESNKSKALNYAMEKVGDALIYFTDDDVRFDRETLLAYSKVSKDVGGGEFYGGPFEADWERQPHDWLKPFLPPSAKGKTYGTKPKFISGENDFFNGLNWAAFSNDIKKVGGFNTTLGPGSGSGSRGQEREMQIRLKMAGVKMVYVPDAKVWHYVPWKRCSPGWALRRNYYHGIEGGILKKATDSRVNIFGNPIWVYKQLFRKAIRILTILYAKNPEERFRKIVDFIYCLGHMRGNWISSKQR